MLGLNVSESSESGSTLTAMPTDELESSADAAAVAAGAVATAEDRIGLGGKAVDCAIRRSSAAGDASLEMGLTGPACAPVEVSTARSGLETLEPAPFSSSMTWEEGRRSANSRRELRRLSIGGESGRRRARRRCFAAFDSRGDRSSTAESVGSEWTHESGTGGWRWFGWRWKV
jgi:hypothetical protein